MYLRVRALACIPLVGLVGIVGACNGRALRVPSSNDPLQVAATDAINHPCEQDSGPVPTLAAEAVPPEGAPPVDERYDVVVYTAHPHDEALYLGGTLTKLGQGGRRVRVVLMSHGEGGRLMHIGAKGLEKRDDIPKEQIAETRDREAQRAAKTMGVEVAWLYPASANADFGRSDSCADTLDHWDKELPGGVTGILKNVIEDIRKSRPRVIIADDTKKHYHGHNRALGNLVDMASRLAADKRIPGTPHVAEEVLATATAGEHQDVAITIDGELRMKALREYPSQFQHDEEPQAYRRKVEGFILLWRAKGVTVPPAGSVLGDVIATTKPR